MVLVPADLPSKIYVSGSDSKVIVLGSHLIDISNPESPVIMASIDSHGASFFSGHYGYAVADTNGFRIIDVSNPHNPVIVGSVDTPVRAVDLAVSGSYAYVTATAWGGTMYVIDISNPISPSIVGSLGGTGGWASGIDVSGAYAYMIDIDGLFVLDVSDPRSPGIVGSVGSLAGITRSGVYASGDYVYVVDTNQRLNIVDVSNPRSPHISAFLDMPAKTNGLYVCQSYAYVSLWTGDVLVIDVSMFSDSEPLIDSPIAPTLKVITKGPTVSVSWNRVSGADGYTLFYAPYPDVSYIGSADMGYERTISGDLPLGTAFYLAVQAYNSTGSSTYSNIEHFTINSSTPAPNFDGIWTGEAISEVPYNKWGDECGSLDINMEITNSQITGTIDWWGWIYSLSGSVMADGLIRGGQGINTDFWDPSLVLFLGSLSGSSGSGTWRSVDEGCYGTFTINRN
jgi:hypothetical protein